MLSKCEALAPVLRSRINKNINEVIKLKKSKYAKVGKAL